MYDSFFKFLNERFFALHGTELKPHSVRLDCEKAVIKSLKSVYGKDVIIKLCTVHILRSWWKKFEHFMDESIMSGILY